MNLRAESGADTALARAPLPPIWRGRFYIDIVFHELLNWNAGLGSLAARLRQTGATFYRDQQMRRNQDPEIIKAGFELYSDKSSTR